jgi:hypothetical protein
VSAYATLEQLASQLRIPLGELPEQAGKWLEEASAMVDELTLGRLRNTLYLDQFADADRTALLLGAQQAVCAQVEAWILAGDDASDIQRAVQSETIGRVSTTYVGAASGGASSMAPRAYRYLRNAGLLYRGVRVS